MMKLYYSLASPYARKVRMAAAEAGVDDRIDLVLTDAWSATVGLPQDNPLCKVPTLVLEDGSPLYDSPVICEYLDYLGGGSLFPPAGPERWCALRLQALGDGLCDAAVARRLEAMRPENLRSASWDQRQNAAMTRACDVLETDIDDLTGPVTIGALAVATALGYLDFRFTAEPWRPGRPRLAAWFEQASQRPSFESTRPPAP
ncbi:MAG: glutathione S-transferase N-terminal domain-containing protein [Rhodospirillaceae bacterium]